MARPLRPERLAHIADAATRAFGRLGYQRTHMADVAAAAGLSSGAIYTYVESKETLFHLVFVHAFDLLAESAPALPLSPPAPGETVAVIREGLRRTAGAPLLRAALDADAPADMRAELAAIVEEQYETIERLWPVLAVIERCAIDLPELEEMYFRRGRPERHAALSRYLSKRAGTGDLRAMADADIAARLVSEATAWFGWHRRDDRDAKRFDDGLARRTVIEFVCDALVTPP
ncbi:MAG: TetR family transcriptional regulator [Acidimicrobiales bacterium]